MPKFFHTNVRNKSVKHNYYLTHKSSVANIFTLHSEGLLHLLAQLSPTDIMHLSATCRYFHRAISSYYDMNLIVSHRLLNDHFHYEKTMRTMLYLAAHLKHDYEKFKCAFIATSLVLGIVSLHYFNQMLAREEWAVFCTLLLLGSLYVGVNAFTKDPENPLFRQQIKDLLDKSHIMLQRVLRLNKVDEITKLPFNHEPSVVASLPSVVARR